MRSHPVKKLFAASLLALPALAFGQSYNGKWTGSGPANMGDPSRCTPTMTVELNVQGAKLAGKLDFGSRVQDIETSVAADGKFETSFINPNGHTVNVSGKLGETMTVVNPIRCGYGNVALKR
jgi:hypothetical protein